MTCRTTILLAAALAATAMLLGGCSGGEKGAPPASTIETPATEPEPPVARFQYHPCQFGVPDGQTNGQTIACGTLEVPERRYPRSERIVRLEVAILRASASPKQPDPIIYLAGGPGGRALEGDLSWWDREFAAPLQDTRDIIFFDQRGAGLSTPSLSCGEFDFMYQLMKYDSEDDASVPLGECRWRLTQTADVEAYNSVENAADIVDLARALGYVQYNLYGVSYGTRLALTAMRDAPAMIRSVILDSTVPLQWNMYAEMSAGFESSLNAFLDACAADATCRSFAPDLRGTLHSVIARLEADPAIVPIEDVGFGVVYEVYVDGGAFLRLLFDAFYDTSILPEIPRGILQVARGDYRMISTLASYSSRNAGESIGMYLSVQCRDEGAFNPHEAIVPVRSFPVLAEESRETVEQLHEDCATWAVPLAPPMENEPVVSDLPTLVLAGQFDPITPPSNGRRAAETLSRSTFIEFPGVGHGALVDVCARNIMSAFFDNPEAPVDTSCVAGMAPRFTAPR